MIKDIKLINSQSIRQGWNLSSIVVVLSENHCMKSVRIRSYSGPYFPVFGMNTERYGVSLRIQFECRKMRTRTTPNTNTFNAVNKC